MKKAVLPESELPDKWYNIVADLPGRLAPHLNPVSLDPLKPTDLATLLPYEVVKQEFSTERWIEIPERVREVYRHLAAHPAGPRRAPRAGARHPSAASTSSMKAVSPAGSHKPNTAVAQAYYNKPRRASGGWPRRPAPASGAAHWPSPARMFGLDVHRLHGQCLLPAEAVPQAADADLGRQCAVAADQPRHQAGRDILARTRTRPAAWASRSARRSRTPPRATTRTTRSAACSTTCLLHQTVIGQEAKKQMEHGGRVPRRGHRLRRRRLQLRGPGLPVHGREADRGAAGPASSPSSRQRARPSPGASYAYDFGDTAGLDAAAQHAHAGRTTSSRRPSTRVACATTVARPA